MYNIVDNKTNEIVFQVETYKQGLNVIQHKEANGYPKKQLIIKIDK